MGPRPSPGRHDAITAVPAFPCAAAVIVAVPGPTPVATPVVSTTATLVSLLAQVIWLIGSGFPTLSISAALNGHLP